MMNQPVEMILARQFTGYLSVPVVLVNTAGTVVFYNEPAERILGVRFEETGRIDREEADRLVELTGGEELERFTSSWLRAGPLI
jgi:PAS domain-containing protein